MARFSNGMLAVLVVVLSLGAAIGVGYMANAHGEDVERQGYEQVSDLTGLFDKSTDPMYVDYDPPENATGYTQFGKSGFSGVDYMSSARYNGNAVFPQLYETSGGLTLDKDDLPQFDTGYSLDKGQFALISDSSAPSLTLLQIRLASGNLTYEVVSDDSSILDMDDCGKTTLSSVVSSIGAFNVATFHLGDGVYVASYTSTVGSIGQILYSDGYTYTFEKKDYRPNGTDTGTEVRTDGRLLVVLASQDVDRITVNTTTGTAVAYDSDGNIVYNGGAGTTCLVYGTGEKPFEMGNTLTYEAVRYGNVAYLDDSYGVRVSDDSMLTCWSNEYRSSDLTLVVEAPKKTFASPISDNNPAVDGTTLVYAPLWKSTAGPDGYGKANWEEVRSGDGQLCVGVEMVYSGGDAWIKVGTSVMTRASDDSVPVWTDNDDWETKILGAWTHYKVDVDAMEGHVTVIPISDFTDFQTYTSLDSVSDTLGGWEAGCVITSMYYPMATEFTLRLDPNGASGSIPALTQKAMPGEEVSFVLPDDHPTRDGYQFMGWSRFSSNTVIDYHPGDTFTTTESDNTLYAVWYKLFDYTLTYDANGGSGVPPAATDRTIMLSHEFPIDASVIPTRDGYEFWGYDYKGTLYRYSDGSFEPSSVTLDHSDSKATLTAHWATVYTVNYWYNLDGHSDLVATETQIRDDGHIVANNHPVTVQPGTKFNGWGTNKDLSEAGTVFQVGESVPAASATVNLYAKVAADKDATFTVTFDANGGTGAPATKSFNIDGILVHDGVRYGSATVPTEYLNANVPTRDGYKLDGWLVPQAYGDQNVVKVPITDGATGVFVTGDTTFVAQWSKLYAYTLTYDANGGTGAPDRVVVNYTGDSWSFQVANGQIARDGYLFDGWNTAADGSGTSYERFDHIVATRDAPSVTLYAQWLPADNAYVKFALDGGTDGPADMTSPTVGEVGQTYTFTIPTTVPTKTDYEFIEWHDYASDKDYKPGDSISVEYGKQVTLTALWNSTKTYTYTLTYDANATDGTVSDMPIDRSFTSKYNGHESVAISTAVPTSARGYTFQEWNTAADGSGTAYQPSTKDQNHYVTVYADQPVTLYAIWHEGKYKMTITYHADSRTGSGDNLRYGTFADGSNTYVETYTFDELPFSYYITDKIPTSASDKVFRWWATNEQTWGRGTYHPGDIQTRASIKNVNAISMNYYAAWSDPIDPIVVTLKSALGGSSSETVVKTLTADSGARSFSFTITEDMVPTRTNSNYNVFNGYYFWSASNSYSGDHLYKVGDTVTVYYTETLHADWVMASSAKATDLLEEEESAPVYTLAKAMAPRMATGSPVATANATDESVEDSAPEYPGWTFSVNGSTVFLDTYGAVLVDPSIDIQKYFPDDDVQRLNFYSFAVYGDSITVNGQTFTVDHGTVKDVPVRVTKGMDEDAVEYHDLELQNIAVSWADGHCYLTFVNEKGDNSDEFPKGMTADLGATALKQDGSPDKTVAFGGVWYFTCAYYKGVTVTDHVYKWDAGLWGLSAEAFMAVWLVAMLSLALVAYHFRGFKPLDYVILGAACLIGWAIMGNIFRGGIPK